MGVTEVLAIDCGVIESGISSNFEEDEVLHTDAKHMTTYLQDGPNKQKPKWTRIQRMECGPMEESKDMAKTVLGKRRCLLSLEEDSNVGAVAGKTKRRKKQDGSPNDEVAGVSQHPCRSQ